MGAHNPSTGSACDLWPCTPLCGAGRVLVTWLGFPVVEQAPRSLLRVGSPSEKEGRSAHY